MWSTSESGAQHLTGIPSSLSISVSPQATPGRPRSPSEGLMVMDEGECDGSIRQPDSSPANQNIDTPMAGEMVDLGQQTVATSKRGSPRG